MRCSNCNETVDFPCRVKYNSKSLKNGKEEALLYRCTFCKSMMIVEINTSLGTEGKILYCGKECLKEDNSYRNAKKVLYRSASKVTGRLQQLSSSL
ncbi:hypothetical protein [[Eubacterium] cellulosolvens]